MAGGVPLLRPNSRDINYSDLVRQMWGDQWHEKDVVYQFRSKKFLDSGTNGGPYTGTATGT